MNKELKGDSSLHLLKDTLQKCSTLALNTSLSGCLSGENHRERIERKNTQAPNGKTEIVLLLVNARNNYDIRRQAFDHV